MRALRPSSGFPIRGIHALALGMLALAVGGLYLPYLRSPLVFDDHVMFFTNRFAYFATHPFGFMPRAPAYFSIASVEVLIGGIEAQRVVSVALHLACAAVLYGFVYALLQLDGPRAAQAGAASSLRRRTAAASLFAAAAFALHPAAVYGAGYLAQRSIVMATLFGLISLWLFLAALQRGRPALAVFAAAAYSLAVLAKEHAILVTVLALPLAMMRARDWRDGARQLIVYWACCAPAAVFLALLMKHVIGQAYEPHAPGLAAAGAALDTGVAAAPFTWYDNAWTQAGLFFRYARDWIVPQTAQMSVDVRMFPLRAGSPLQAAPILAAWFGVVLVALGLLLRGRRAAIAGFGMLYYCVLFLVELSVLRVQEVYVLYRSYLWAPGIAIAGAALLDRLGARAALAACVVAVPVLAFQAQDRLETFASPLRLWEDAAAKLPPGPVPLGTRVLYNLGREYLRAGDPEKALATAERCASIYPAEHQCVYAQGAIHFHLGNFVRALNLFQRAAELNPQSGQTQHRIGLTQERFGRIEDAKRHYRSAVRLGYIGGAMELSRLEEPMPKSPPSGDSVRRAP